MGKSTWIPSVRQRSYHGKGWNSARLFTKRKSKLEKESTFLQIVWQPQTSAQYPASLMQKTKVIEYDSSSDEEVREADDLVEKGTSDLGNQQITRDVDFLVRVTSRFFDKYGSTVDSFCKVHRNSTLNLGLTYSYNLQRFVFPSGEGQELGLTPVSPGPCRSKFQLL